VQAIQVATLNGAIFLGRQDQIGSISIGRNADLESDSVMERRTT
jgi:imidazolonepropionase-like amidohydrolase